ncbi:MAG: PEP-CTERM sorting domain-containing protein [Candidatus Hydrogenedentota bacterium]
MKTRIAVLRTAAIVAAMMLAMTAGASVAPGLEGPGAKPDWESSAQVRLGWGFDESGASYLLDDPWNRYIGDEPPGWRYSPPQLPDNAITAQQTPYWWWLQLPNVNKDNPYKRIWMSFVYSAEQAVPEGAIDITSTPETVQELVYQDTVPLNGKWQTRLEYRLWPNPSWEQIGFPLEEGQEAPFLHEAYIMTECVPEPATMTVLGIGLAGFAVRRFRQRFHA